MSKQDIQLIVDSGNVDRNEFKLPLNTQAVKITVKKVTRNIKAFVVLKIDMTSIVQNWMPENTFQSLKQNVTSYLQWQSIQKWRKK